MGALATLRESSISPAHTAPVQSIAFGPDPETFATGDTQRHVRVVVKGEPVFSLNLSSKQDKVRPTERIRGLAFSPGGETLYVACGDLVQALSMTSGVARWSYRPPRSFGFLIVSPIALAVSKAGDVAIATDAGRMSVWTSEGALKSHWWDNDSPRLLSFANGEGLLGTDSFTLASWKAATGRKQHRQKLRERAFGFAATPDGARACIRTIHHVELIDTGSNEVLESYPLEFGPPLVTISSGGDIVAFSGLNDITVRRVGTDHVHRLQVTGAYVRSLKLSPDGRSVAAGCSDGTLRFWNLD